ncbi:MAG: protein SCO1/2 [Phycisphaerales bacterium]|jgi:protein SCO1/2
MKTALVFAGLFVLGLVGIVVLWTLRPAPATLDPFEPPVTMIVPEFTAVNRDGDPVDQTVLDGQYTVMDFFFTSCPLYCPGMTAAMKRVHTEVGSDHLRLLSLSIDGPNDTPEVIGRYADGFGVDADQWVFATAPTQTVWPMISQMGFLVEYDQGSPVNNPSGDSMPMINHPTRLMLVGPDRRVIGLYRYTDQADLDALIARLNGLLD